MLARNSRRRRCPRTQPTWVVPCLQALVAAPFLALYLHEVCLVGPHERKDLVPVAGDLGHHCAAPECWHIGCAQPPRPAHLWPRDSVRSACAKWSRSSAPARLQTHASGCRYARATRRARRQQPDESFNVWSSRSSRCLCARLMRQHRPTAHSPVPRSQSPARGAESAECLPTTRALGTLQKTQRARDRHRRSDTCLLMQR